jgi:hypothetical protein
MKVLSGGHFALTLESKDLLKGLRKNYTQPRNSGGLIELSGVIGKDGVLQRFNWYWDQITDGLIETDNFPWPQVFQLDKHIVFCNEDSILEYNADFDIVSKISGLTGSTFPWQAASSYDWIYFVNGVEAVVRNPETHAYSLDSSLPVGPGVCNYNGQIIVGNQVLNY